MADQDRSLSWHKKQEEEPVMVIWVYPIPVSWVGRDQSNNSYPKIS